MRMIVFFDLPVAEKEERRAATKFRNFLIKDGFQMVQFSVYDSVATHEKRIESNLPPNGSIRLLIITEKQYESMRILLGDFKQSDVPVAFEQLTLL